MTKHIAPLPDPDAGAAHVVLKRRKVRRSHSLQVPRAEEGNNDLQKEGNVRAVQLLLGHAKN